MRGPSLPLCGAAADGAKPPQAAQPAPVHCTQLMLHAPSTCSPAQERLQPFSMSVQIYQRCGVDRPRLVVIPEAVDVHVEFNPEHHSPLPLPIGMRVFGRPARRGVVGGVGGGRGSGGEGGSGRELHEGRPFTFLSIFKVNWAT